MRASGNQLREVTSLIESGVIRPVVDKVFPFESIKQAMAYVEMMTGTGPCGPVEMGGMFTAMMVRDNLPANVFTDTWTEVNGKKPDWYKQPSDTISYKWTGESMEPVRQPVRAAETKKAAPAIGKDTRSVAPKNEIRVTVRKPSGQAAR